MRIAYYAGSLPEGQLILDMLQAAGIEARMLNQNAQSTAGEIPPAVAGPQIWVMEDGQLDRARLLIEEHLLRPVPPGRTCPRCGEENPGNFLSCWACGAEFFG
jgi:hypothetical protein